MKRWTILGATTCLCQIVTFCFDFTFFNNKSNTTETVEATHSFSLEVATTLKGAHYFTYAFPILALHVYCTHNV